MRNKKAVTLMDRVEAHAIDDISGKVYDVHGEIVYGADEIGIGRYVSNFRRTCNRLWQIVCDEMKGVS